MTSRSSALAICPSASSIIRSAASLRRVPWGGFPDLAGSISRLRLLAPRRASLRLLRSALPPLRPCSFPRGRTTPRGPGPLLSRRPRRLSTVEKTRPPRFLGDPCVHAPLSDPGGPPSPGPYRNADGAFRVHDRVGSAMRQFRGSITRPARSLCTLRSRGRPRTCATLDSGRWPALAGRDFHPLGRVEDFRRVFPFTSPSLLTRLCLAQREMALAISDDLPRRASDSPRRPGARRRRHDRARRGLVILVYESTSCRDHARGALPGSAGILPA